MNFAFSPEAAHLFSLFEKARTQFRNFFQRPLVDEAVYVLVKDQLKESYNIGMATLAPCGWQISFRRDYLTSDSAEIFRTVVHEIAHVDTGTVMYEAHLDPLGGGIHINEGRSILFELSTYNIALEEAARRQLIHTSNQFMNVEGSYRNQLYIYLQGLSLALGLFNKYGSSFLEKAIRNHDLDGLQDIVQNPEGAKTTLDFAAKVFSQTINGIH